MMTIPVGQTLCRAHEVLGEVAEVSAVLATRRTTALCRNRGGAARISTSTRSSSAGFSLAARLLIQYRGGTRGDGDGLLWEVNGTEGRHSGSGTSGTRRWEAFPKGRGATRRFFGRWRFTPPYRFGWPERGDVERCPSICRMARDCARAPARRRASTMRLTCIASSKRSRERRTRKSRRAGVIRGSEGQLSSLR